MYSIPLIIDERRLHYCMMKSGGGAPFDGMQFVISAEKSRVLLFRIPEDASVFLLENTENRFKWLNQYSVRIGYSSVGSTAKIKFLLKEHKHAGDFLVKGKKKSGQFSLEREPGVLGGGAKDQCLYSNGEHSFEKIEIEFVIEGDSSKGGDSRGSFMIHLAKPAFQDGEPGIHHAIFDFGSDSSQVSIKYPGSSSFESIDILDEVERSFYNKFVKDARKAKNNGATSFKFPIDYTQRNSNKFLFTTKVFVKREYGRTEMVDGEAILNGPPRGPQIAYPPNTPPDATEEKLTIVDTPELVSIMTPGAILTEEEERFLAPNLKLAALYDFFKTELYFQSEKHNPDPRGGSRARFSQISESLHRITLNKFIHVILQSIASTLSTRERPYLNLTLLVPNVYDQELVNDILKGLVVDVKDYVNNSEGGNNNFKYPFLGIEISTLSESDASFLGMLAEERLGRPNYDDLYLSIDCGKGTMDLSVIRVDQFSDESTTQNYTSLYRSGFAGAGNVLTYAFVETVVGLWIGPEKEKRREFIFEQIINGPINEQIKFLEYMEILKKNYSKEDKGYLQEKANQSIRLFSEDGTKEGLKELNTALKDYIEEVCNSIPDKFGWIEGPHGVIRELTQKVVDQLQIFKVKKIRFKKILLAGRSFLFEPFRRDMEKALGAFCEGWNENLGFRDEFNYENHILYPNSDPKQICIRGAADSRAINLRASMVGLPYTEMRKANGRDRNERDADRAPESREKEKSSFFGIFKKGRNEPEARGVGRYQDFFGDLGIKFFLKGSGWRPANSEIMLNSKNLRDAKGLDSKGDFQLFFSGESYFIRTKDGKSKKLTSVNKRKGSLEALAWKSVFPFVQDDDADNVVLSELRIGYEYVADRAKHRGRMESMGHEIALNSLEELPDFGELETVESFNFESRKEEASEEKTEKLTLEIGHDGFENVEVDSYVDNGSETDRYDSGGDYQDEHRNTANEKMKLDYGGTVAGHVSDARNSGLNMEEEDQKTIRKEREEEEPLSDLGSWDDSFI